VPVGPRVSRGQRPVEAWTAQGRRRSDVAVTFPDGTQMAIEVQLAAMTDTELLARRDDYARAGTVLVWVWHSEKRIPRSCSGSASQAGCSTPRPTAWDLPAADLIMAGPLTAPRPGAGARTGHRARVTTSTCGGCPLPPPA
jgi:hypothetical protein